MVRREGFVSSCNKEVQSRSQTFTVQIYRKDFLSSCRCVTTSHGVQETMKKNESNAQLVSLCARRFGTGHWSFLGLVSEKKNWYSISADSPQGEWDRMAEKMMLEFEESGHPFSVPRVHCSEVSSKAKAVENCRYTIVPIWKR